MAAGKQKFWNRRLGLGLLGALSVAACVCQNALADPYYDSGLRFYQEKNYKMAAAYFSQAVRNNPYDANALYYQALMFQTLGDRSHAITNYARLVSQFADCRARSLAVNALMQLDPAYCRQLLKGSQSGSQFTGADGASNSHVVNLTPSSQSAPSDLAGLPNQSRVDFVTSPNDSSLLMVKGRLNGRDCSFIFDTGAGECCIGMNTLRDLNIPTPTGSPTVTVAGVGGSGIIPAWKANLTIQLGSITRQMPVLIVQDRSEPLLGQTFFRDFAYSIDTNVGNKNAGTITFTKRNASAIGIGQPTGRSNVKFELFGGQHIVVPVDVDGHPTKMIFDTGAAGIMFTRGQLNALHITIPDDAQQIRNQGVGGETSGVLFPIRRISMGPIDKFDIMVGAVDGAVVPYPLLGQTFFSDWKYTIDYDNKVINFQKR